jgi:hypothetical protein
MLGNTRSHAKRSRDRPTAVSGFQRLLVVGVGAATLILAFLDVAPDGAMAVRQQ